MLVPADAVAQRRYVRAARQAHPTPRLGIGPSILRGLRDLGFRDSAAAICALVDNAIDAQARDIDVLVEISGGAVTALAVMDNGIGMVPEMMRAACAVGATCPLGDGPHLARSGFGLPSAPFAIGHRFELLSSPTGAAPVRLLFDLDELTSDDVLVPQARRAEFPPFVLDYLRGADRIWSGGTVVLLEDLDRLAPRSPASLTAQLASRLGLVFCRFLDRVTIRVNGVRVAPVDPLFLLADAPDAPGDAAAAIDTGVFRVALDDAEMLVRTALLPPGFAGKERRRPVNAPADRATIVREHQGFLISRLGRRLTSLPASPWFNFAASDRAIRVELDFPPALDEWFAPALSLQQVQVSHTVWSALRAAGIADHLDAMRRRFRDSRSRERAAERRQWSEAAVRVA